MPLLRVDEILNDAKKKKYAVPAYDVINYETMKWSVDAAEIMNLPVILMMYPAFQKMISFKTFCAMAKDIAEQASVPVAVHLDHSQNYDEIMEAIECGFTSVMFDGSKLPYEENVEITTNVVISAHKKGASVEAELGFVGRGENRSDFCDSSLYTDPDQAADFVERTGADALAVAIGNSHGIYIETPKLDIPRLKRLQARVPVPMVLHGTSQIPDSQLTEAVKNGIAKTNIATELYVLMYETVKKSFSKEKKESSYFFYLYDELRPAAIEYFVHKYSLLNPDINQSKGPV